VATEEGWKFFDPGPITEEEKLEAAQLWDQITQGKASPGKKIREQDPLKQGLKPPK
jgi:hypothetical protein